MENIDDLVTLLESNHNLILTGAPGTGKTYLAKQIAAKMTLGNDDPNNAESALLLQSHIGFVQFHPSYDYTDFVEGLRPIPNVKGKSSTISFERRDGIFKQFCAKAQQEEEYVKIIARTAPSKNDLLAQLKKMCNSEYFLHTQGMTKKQFRIEHQEPDNYYIDGKYQINPDALWCAYSDKNTIDIDNSYFEKKFNSNPTEYFFNKNDKKTKNFITYRSFYYLAIFEEIKKGLDSVDRKSTLSPYVFIIDEINRGEVSKIFGELFFAIDPGYRGTSGRVQTQYQTLVLDGDVFKEGFYVPNNVYIIGTMNDIDRSVESMDFAFRRRFTWKEISAKDSQSMLAANDKIKNRMNNLNNCIIDRYTGKKESSNVKIGLTKDYQIGAAYFLKYKKDKPDYLWNYHLEGLLLEYLRGSTDIEQKIELLHTAYNDDKAKPNSGKK